MATQLPPQASGLPLVGKTFTYMHAGHLDFLDAVFEECGDIATVKVAAVGEYCLLSRPAYFEQVLIEENDAFEKTDDFDVLSGNGVLAVEGETWKRQRQVLTEFFYPRRVESYATDMATLAERRLNHWEPGDELLLYDEARALTLDILFKTLFDYELELGGDEELRWAVRRLNLPMKDHVWALPDWVPLLAWRRYHKACEILEQQAHRFLKEREARDELGDDLLSTLVRVRADREATLTDQEIIDNLRTLFFAGHDTTANLIACALHQLGSHPEVRARFHDELDAVLDGEPPSVETVDELEVADRVINETLRRYPSVNLLPRRTVRDVEIGGYHVPEGMRVHLSLWNLHRHPEFWTKPNAWRPSRWETTTREEKEATYTFLPFLAGPHSCLGKTLARLEAKIVLATIGQHYWFDPQSELELENAGTARPHDKGPARIVARD